MRAKYIAVLVSVPLWLVHYGCASTAGSELDTDGSGSSKGVGGSGMDDDMTLTTVGGTGVGGSSEPCTPTDDNDWDQDGFTINDGDCNDCVADINPNAVEVITESGVKQDEDCDGETDEDDVYTPCDEDIAIDETDPLVAVKAVGLCKLSSGEKDWGVVSAKWALPDGAAPSVDIEPEFHRGHGILPDFGPNVAVRHGARMLALSSGTARRPSDVGYKNVEGHDKNYTVSPPVGFPKESPACPGITTGAPHDAAGLEVVVRTPGNAHGFSFDFNFYTFEWPEFVCSQYNDFFVALLSPIPEGQADGNISFDTQNNPVSVNNAFVEVCGCAGNPPNACIAGGKSFSCNLGNAELIGTGFGFDTSGSQDHAATSWLTTTAPVEPNSEITLRWTVYDSGDGVLDSTTLVDNWRWTVQTGTGVQTQPVPK